MSSSETRLRGAQASAPETVTKSSRALLTHHAWVQRGGASYVSLPLASGAAFSANPGFVMAIEALSPTQTEVTVAGKGRLVVDMAYADVLDALAGV